MRNSFLMTAAALLAWTASAEAQQPAPQITVEQPPPSINVEQPAPEVTVNQPPPQVIIQQAAPQVTVRQAPARIIVRQPPPEIIVRQFQPQVIVRQREPEVIIEQAQPEVQVERTDPQVSVEQLQPTVEVQQPQPVVTIQQPPAQVETTPAPAPAPVAGVGPEQMIGRPVVNPTGEQVGSIRDFLLTPAGTIERAIVDAGSFLGVGSKLVAVPWDQASADPAAPHVVIPLDRQQLEAVPEYVYDQADNALVGPTR